MASIARQWILGDAVCYILGVMSIIFYLTNFVMILVLTLDRFFTIFIPFFYDRNGNKVAVGTCMSLFVWLITLYHGSSISICKILLVGFFLIAGIVTPIVWCIWEGDNGRYPFIISLTLYMYLHYTSINFVDLVWSFNLCINWVSHSWIVIWSFYLVNLVVIKYHIYWSGIKFIIIITL